MNKAELLNKVKNVYSERQLIASLRRDKLLASYRESHPQQAQRLESQAESRWEDLSNILELAAKNALAESEGSFSKLSTLPELSKHPIPAAPNNSSSELPEFNEIYKNIYKSTNFCELCNDTAIYNGGKCPKCFNATWVKVLRDNIDPLLPLAEHNFANFDLNIFSDDTVETSVGKVKPKDQIQGILDLSKQFLADFPKSSDNLFFTGRAGTGKTYLAECIANAVLEKNYLALVLNMLKIEEIINNLRTRQRSFSTKAEQLSKAQSDYKLLLEADLLVIDDLGLQTDLLTNPLAELIAILRERNINNKITIITSNYDIKELKKVFDERLFSRLMQNFKMLPFVGEDLRLKRR